MLKKFLNGLLFGTGFGIAFSVVALLALTVLFPKFVGAPITYSEKNVTTVPAVPKVARYLGSTGSYAGEFKNDGTLTGGPGAIVGKAFVDGKALAGLKLRLALNGSVVSQWATTDAQGEYRVSVPFGEYIVDGFELDHASANQVLANKIEQPHVHFSRHNSAFTVDAGAAGKGMDFFFVEPVKKLPGKTQVNVSDDIVLEWQAYPGATQYSLQLLEKTAANSWNNQRLFEWGDKPKVTQTKINLHELDVQLKPGHFYVLEIEARDAQKTVLSETPPMYSGYDFEVTE